MCGTTMDPVGREGERMRYKALCPILPMDGVLPLRAPPPSDLRRDFSLEE